MGQQIFQVSNAFQRLALLVFDLLAFQGRQAAQLHVQDRLRLALTQIEARHQTLFCHIRIR